MKIALGSDHAGFQYKTNTNSFLLKEGIEVIDFGTNSTESVDYPDFAKKAAQAVVDGLVDYAIIICGSGIGVSITANKIKGVRAANCLTEEMAELAREHNNANVLTLGERLIDWETAKKIIEKFLNTPASTNLRHQARINKIE
jgi:ribose 5-phosphate isomerase B